MGFCGSRLGRSRPYDCCSTWWSGVPRSRLVVVCFWWSAPQKQASHGCGSAASHRPQARTRMIRNYLANTPNRAMGGTLRGWVRRCDPCDRPAAHIVGRDRAILAADTAGGICARSRGAVSRGHGNACPCPLAARPDRPSYARYAREEFTRPLNNGSNVYYW